ncbi:unnamed protein product [Dracunculus medinensis]|uniref:Exocyst complex component 7 n=1 Tax=Dracunculus medinensis TaxID=318479 RepID=A0A3P7TCQ9_DRAME|nr:unnamed protein product [Dracunculus medinensis]
MIQIEAEVMKKIIVDVSAEAKIQRELIVRPLRNVIDRSSRLLDENEYALIPLLPLLKHVNSHHNQLSSLADNANGQIPYQAFYNKLRSKCTSSLDEFLDRLASDSNKYVPDDGNVHQITSDTLNFLNGLLEYRQTVSQLLTTSSSNNSSHHLPRLFARILSALGLNLKNKAENYSDETLAAIFLLNNNNYIHSILQNDGMLSIVCEHNAQIHSFYRSEINLYKSKYLQSWNKVVATLLSDELIITDRHSIKAVILAFNAEFEKVVNTQKDYCITDLKLSCDIKNEVKNLVCEKYADFYARINRLQIFRGLEKHLKYTPQSLERVMDRLFVVSG